MSFSEIGIGTYLGTPDEYTDNLYYKTIKTGINLGINVVDTAINYRNMRSERVIGKVLDEIDRDRVILSTKGGYIPVDSNFGDNPKQWFKSQLLDTGIISKEDITPFGNVLTPKYIEWSFNKSLENLNTSYVDIYFIHNPEDQLQTYSVKEFYEKLEAIFSILERKIQKGELRFYGFATWNGFRVPENHVQFLDLVEILEIAKKVGGENHHFRFIQLPYNLAMPEAFLFKNQTIKGKKYSVLETAKLLGIYTYTSAPLLQGRLLNNINSKLKQVLKVPKENLVPLQFVRSTLDMGTMLVGMSKEEHLKDNIEIYEYEEVDKEVIQSLLESMQIGRSL
ncbi:MAG: aldo/keto reductase [Aquificae bacterium]|nr:aldo/keto reductase [Aquificota bacterium]